jgi:hypothetical protein
MNKKERIEAASLIRSTTNKGKRFELKLPCGMTVRCDNTEAARDRMAAKFEKGNRFKDASRLLTRRLWK